MAPSGKYVSSKHEDLGLDSQHSCFAFFFSLNRVQQACTYNLGAEVEEMRRSLGLASQLV